jgi:hypothetical protein
MKTHRLHLLLAFVLGICVPVLLLAVARVGAPWEVNQQQDADAVQTVLSIPLSGSELQRPITYIRVDDEKGLLQRLRQTYPGLRFAPWSERPPDSGCRSSDPSIAIVGTCERDDYLRASVSSYPLWNTALANVSWSNGGAEAVLVKVWGKWRVLSRRLVVT